MKWRASSRTMYASDARHPGSGGIRFYSVPMMAPTTPISTSLANGLLNRLLGFSAGGCYRDEQRARGIGAKAIGTVTAISTFRVWGSSLTSNRCGVDMAHSKSDLAHT